MQKGFIHIVIVAIVVFLLGITSIVGYATYKKDGAINNVNIAFSLKPTEAPIPLPTPTPVPTGNLKGKVVGGYYLRPVKNVSIKINNILSTTNSSGEFEITGIAIGKYKLTFSHPEYTFVPFDTEIKEGENVLSGNVTGILSNPKPTQVHGTCFIDSNNNKSLENGEAPLDAMIVVYFYESGQWVNQTYSISTTNGSYSLSLSKIGKYKIEPSHYTFYEPPIAQEIITDGYGGNKIYNFGYLPLKVESGFTVYVFNDKNENGQRDSDEENVNFQYVRVTNLSGVITTPLGSTYNVAVNTNGETFNQFEPGNYRFELIPEDASWSNYFKVTKSSQEVAFSKNTPHQTIYLGAHKLY